MTKKEFSKLGFSLLISAISANGASVAAQTLLENLLAGQTLTYASLVAFYIVFVLVALLCFNVLFKRGADVVAPDVGTKQKQKLSFIVIVGLFCLCMACSYIFNLIGIGTTWALSSIIYGRTTDMLNPVTNIMGDNILLSFLVVGLIAPVCEEFMFRKLLLDRLRPAGELAAILFCGLSFGLYHLNFTQFFYAAALGLIFAYITIKTGTILYSSILHILINTLSSTVMAQLATKVSLATDPSLKVLYSMLVLSIMGIFIVGGVIFLAIIISKKAIVIEKTDGVAAENKTTFSKAFLNVGVILFTVCCLTAFVVLLGVQQ